MMKPHVLKKTPSRAPGRYEDIGVITFYSAQVSELKARLEVELGGKSDAAFSAEGGKFGGGGKKGGKSGGGKGEGTKGGFSTGGGGKQTWSDLAVWLAWVAGCPTSLKLATECAEEERAACPVQTE